jgi:hypothetical protein
VIEAARAEAEAAAALAAPELFEMMSNWLVSGGVAKNAPTAAR